MSNKGTILVVDDEQTIGDALSVILSDNGYQAVLATSGSKARDRADKVRFDVAIIDVGLPDMSGLDLLAYLRKRNPTLRVIIMTAQPTPDIIEEATRLGAVAVLHKPFPPSDILDLIKPPSNPKRRQRY